MPRKKMQTLDEVVQDLVKRVERLEIDGTKLATKGEVAKVRAEVRKVRATTIKATGQDPLPNPSKPEKLTEEELYAVRCNNAEKARKARAEQLEEKKRSKKRKKKTTKR